jgi:hypothetical protein
LDHAEIQRNPIAFVSFARGFQECLESYHHSERIADPVRADSEVEIHVVYDTPDGKQLGHHAVYPSACPDRDADDHRRGQIRAVRRALILMRLKRSPEATDAGENEASIECPAFASFAPG